MMLEASSSLAIVVGDLLSVYEEDTPSFTSGYLDALVRGLDGVKKFREDVSSARISPERRKVLLRLIDEAIHAYMATDLLFGLSWIFEEAIERVARLRVNMLAELHKKGWKEEYLPGDDDVPTIELCIDSGGICVVRAGYVPSIVTALFCGLQEYVEAFPHGPVVYQNAPVVSFVALCIVDYMSDRALKEYGDMVSVTATSAFTLDGEYEDGHCDISLTLSLRTDIS